MTTHVQLIENNAGRLFLGTPAGPWWDVTGSREEAADDVAGILQGETDNWTVERYDDQPDGEIVGEWIDGEPRIVLERHIGHEPKAGLAARDYMGIDW